MAARRAGLGFGNALILAGAFAFVALIFAMLARVEPIEVVSSRLARSGDQVSVEGLLRNSGPTSGPISLEVRYFDNQGRRLGEDRVPLDNLRSGAEVRFSSPARRLAEVQSFTVYVDHGRNPYGN